MLEKLKKIYASLEKGLGNVAKLGGEILSAFGVMIKSYVSEPKRLLLTVLGIILVLDIYKKGEEGVITFLVTKAQDIYTTVVGEVVKGGWPMVAALALIFLIVEKVLDRKK